MKWASVRRAQAQVWICALSVLIGASLLPGFTSLAAAAAKCHRAGVGCDTDSNCCSGLSCQAFKCEPIPCAAEGGTCAVGSDCCSGNCASGVCCDSGDVGLSNGTCATPCTVDADCSSCGSAVCDTDSSGAHLCTAGGDTATTCVSDTGCPLGEFCRFNGGVIESCAPACQ